MKQNNFILDFFIVIAFILLLFLTSCNKLKEGIITKRIYEPPRTYVTFMYISTGKSMTMIPVPVYDGEDFIIEIEGEYKGKKRIEQYYVPKSLWDTVKVGKLFCVNGLCDSEDNNNKRK